MADAKLLLSVSDNGRGLPADFDMAKSKGLGMRVVMALTKQLGGNITHHSSIDGTDSILSVPTSNPRPD
jgi:two-component system, sensor histidine kinase PdtaS